MRSNLLGQWAKLVGGAQPREVQDVQPAFTKERANLTQERLTRRSAEFANAWNDKTVNRQVLFDL